MSSARSFLLRHLLLPLLPVAALAGPPVPPNVLFIAVDDLRPELGVYGAAHMRTPHLDSLAARGFRLDRAYCQQAVCSPSRTSVLTGLRPETTRVFDLTTHFRSTVPDAITLPEQFKQHGYRTQAVGKIFHNEGLDDPRSWSEPAQPHDSLFTWHDPVTRAGLLAEMQRRIRAAGGDAITAWPHAGPLPTGVALPRGPAWESHDAPDENYPDAQIARQAIAALQAAKAAERPFFLAVGFLRPHLPFVAPKKYFDLYPPESISLPANAAAPIGVPALALHPWGELRSYAGIPSAGPLPEEQARDLIRAYRASVSFADAQLGRVLAELDRLGMRDNTLVVVWGDHGFALADNSLWCKHSNFEAATRVPVLLAGPGVPAGSHSAALAELVDLYPTLCELAGLPTPAGLEGDSLTPLWHDPAASGKSAVFFHYRSDASLGYTGYSIRTAGWRYTEWRADDPGATPAIAAQELYDHRTDPGETCNLAADPVYRAIVSELSARLAAGWRAARE
jgi:arylsulfatase A-like enzyme